MHNVVRGAAETGSLLASILLIFRAKPEEATRLAAQPRGHALRAPFDARIVCAKRG